MKRSFIELITGKIGKETRILLIASNIFYLGEGMFGPMLAVFTQRIGGNIMDIAWAWAIYLWTTGLMAIIIGKVSDKHIAHRYLLIVGYILNALFTFLYILVQAPVHLFLVQIGLGIASACSSPTWEVLYSFYNKVFQRGYEWGLAEGQAQIYTAFGILIGGLILEYTSFKVLFITMGLIQVLATIVQAMLFRYPNEPNGQDNRVFSTSI
jgi:predicted MFS family arabinose efflux permease